MKNKIKVLKDFPEIKEKGELLSIYVGMLNCISISDAYQLLDDFNVNKYKFESITKRLVYRDPKEDPSIMSIFLDAYNKLDSLEYRQRIKAAKLLYRISLTIKNNHKKAMINLTDKLLRSSYTYIRNYGYEIATVNNFDIPKKILIKNWETYYDYQCIKRLLGLLTKKELFDLFGEGEDIYDEYDFDSLKIRNEYYSKIMDYIPNRIENLKRDDVVSYAYVMLGADKKIDSKTALNIYKKNPSSSLIKCYGRMKLWDVLETIYNNLK